MDRQTNYAPRPEIARMQSFNAEDGFNSYHVEWKIWKLLGNANLTECVSENFETNDGEQKWKLLFFMMIGDDEDEYSKACINLRIPNSDDNTEIPIIARVKMINVTKGVIEYSSSSAFLLMHWAQDWDIPMGDAKKLSFADEYMIHCWMDIPKKYDGRCNYGQNSGSTLLSSSLARSFGKITNKDGDPTSDIELVIKDGSEDPPRFYCHRVILAARSPVFETMFTNDRFKESNERIVEIDDMDAITLKLLLQYLYTGEISKKLQKDSPKELIKSLLKAAEKYMLPELKDECAFALIGSGEKELRDVEWIECLQLAESFNLEYLRKVCMLALSTNMRLLGEEDVRGSVSPGAMTELLDLVTKRAEMSTTIEVDLDEEEVD